MAPDRYSKRELAAVRVLYRRILASISHGSLPVSLGLLGKLMRSCANLHRKASAEQRKRLRDAASRMLKNKSMTTKQEGIAGDNFNLIIQFLQSKLPPKRNRRKRASGSLSTYVLQMKNLFEFADSRHKRIIELSQEDLKVFRIRYPSSMRITKELLSQTGIARTGGSTLDLDDPALRPERVKELLEYIQLPDRYWSSTKLFSQERLVIMFAYDLFMREDEVATLKWQDIVLDSPLPGLYVTGKGAKRRYIPIAQYPHIGEILSTYVGDVDGYVVCSNDGRGYSRSGIAAICRSGLKKLGLPAKNPHFLRHLGISRDILSGVPLPEASAMAGHTFISTTIREYFHGQILLAKRILEGKTLLYQILGCEPIRLSVREAAKLSGLGVRAMQHLCASGRIKASKIKGDWCISESDFISKVRAIH